MKIKNIVSMFLAGMMMFACLSGVFGTFGGVYAYADEETEETTKTYEIATAAARKNAYSTLQSKITSEAALGYTKLLAANGDYQIYANVYTGEVYFKNIVTGDILSTNPASLSGVATSLQNQFLSQIAIKFSDTSGAVSTYYSFAEAAERGQISAKQIRNGIRMEYTIGRTDTNYLIPGWITTDRFESLILEPIAQYIVQIMADEQGEELQDVLDQYDLLVNEYNEYRNKKNDSEWLREFNKNADAQKRSLITTSKTAADFALNYLSNQYYYTGMTGVSSKPIKIAYFQYMKLRTTYALQDPNSAKGQAKAAIIASYPICGKIDNGYGDVPGDVGTGVLYTIYTLDDTTPDKTKKLLESYVKTYCIDTYNYDEKAKDTSETGYVSTEAAPAFFRLSLEYTITDDGKLSIRLPANGIRYDEVNFSLLSMDILQYFGAGNINDEGYLFYPDGSGTLLEFTDLKKQTSAASLTNKIYGEDYAYYEVSNKHQQSIRVPVYGIVDTKTTTTTTTKLAYDSVTGAVKTVQDITSGKVSTGFVTYITAGETLASLTLAFGGSSHNYATVYPSFTPSQNDSYTLTDSISVSTDSKEWTVLTEKKYLSGFVMKVQMLTDPDVAEAKGVDNYYEASWVGMANAYRDFLWNGVEKLSDTEENLPLYIESFGSVETVEKIMSIPVTVDKALTSFEDIVTMYEELSAAGINNINFKLTGYTNGGMYATYPTKVDWMRSVGGYDGFNDLLTYAAGVEDGHLGIYPDFEFSYISTQKLFDGTYLKNDVSRTVDNRYASKKIYNCVYQEYETNFDLVVSPEAISRHYFNDFKKRYTVDDGVEIIGISASSLGMDLNSTFYDENPYNRDDAKSYVTGVLADMKESYGSVMVGGGNAYVLRYADHILDLPLDTSDYKYSSRTVPFLGMVLHGYVEYAGSAINEAGDSNYHILRSIENGANLYYILSYANTTILKEDELLSQYYSIRYDIWVEDLIEQYNVINDAIGDLQTYDIVDEITLIAERIPDSVELNRYRTQLKNMVAEALEDKIESQADEFVHDLRFQIVAKRLFEGSNDIIAAAKTLYASNKATAVNNYNNIKNAVDAVVAYFEAYDTAVDDGLEGDDLTNAVAAELTAMDLAIAAYAPASDWKRREADYRAAKVKYEASLTDDTLTPGQKANILTAFNNATLYKTAVGINRAYVLGNAEALYNRYMEGEYNTELLMEALRTKVSEVWGTVTESQYAILADMYNTYAASGKWESLIGKSVSVSIDRNAVLTSVYTELSDLLNKFNADIAADFKVQLEEAIDDVIAKYYADFAIFYVENNLTYTTDREGKPVYEDLTLFEKGALTDAIGYFFVAEKEEANQENVEAYVKAYLNNANNDAAPLTKYQQYIIRDMITYFENNGFNGDKVTTVDDIDFTYETIYTDSSALDEKYVSTQFTVSDDSVVMVIYENEDGNRVGFILNFNIFNVVVRYNHQEYRIGSYGFQKVELD